jgi:two-component system sensor histidine kinase MprB
MRTPLTSLRTNLELLEHLEQLPASERAELLEAVQVDVGELTHLLTELVELATDVSDDEVPEALDLAELARQVVQRASRRSSRDITVVETGAEVLVSGRPLMLERAISNLVDNAVKYSPAGTPIEVTVGPGRVEVRDHGPGIAPEDQPYVFERFYRSTAARTEPGSGLGLAIVEQIVARHGGRAWASSSPEGGAVVGFQLPVTATGAVTQAMSSTAR